MAQYAVTASDLETAARELKGMKTTYDEKVAALNKEEEALSEFWEGKARIAFNQSYAEDKKILESFGNITEKFAIVLEELAKDYQQTEDDNEQTARGSY